MRHKVVNLASLAIIQVSNAVLPLVIFPFTLATVGADLYAKIVFSEALSLFLLAIVLYSFEVDGVAQVVGFDLKRDVEQISRIFSRITCFRLILFGCSAPLMILVALFIDTNLVPIVLCWMLVPLSYVIQPNWLFQGLERNRPVAVLTALTRGAAVVIIFAMVSGKSDYLLVPFIIGSLYLLGAACSLFYVLHKFEVRFVRVAWRDIKETLWSGKEIFLGNLSVILYRDANVIVLTLLGVSGSGIAAYSVAEKLVKALQAGIRPLNQFFFPKAIRIAQKSGVPTRLVFRELLRITIPQLAVLAAFVVTLVAAYFSIGREIPMVRRIENPDYVFFLLVLMSAATFFGVSNFMFGSAGLNVLGERRYLLVAMGSTGLISLISCVGLVFAIGVLGAAISFVLAEAVLLFFIVRKYLQWSPL